MNKTSASEKRGAHSSGYDEFVSCRVCGRQLKSVTPTHLKLHGLTAAQYKEKFGLDYLASQLVRARISQRSRRRREGDRFEPRSREQIVREIREFGSNEPQLTYARLLECRPSLARQARRLMGSWEAILKATGLGPPLQQSWSNDRIVAAIRERASAGFALNPAAVKKEAHALVAAAEWYFGGWREAVETSGLDYSKVIRFRRRTHETIARDLRAWVREHGMLRPQKMIVTDAALYEATRAKYGSLEKAARVLGLPFGYQQQRWSKSLVIEKIRRRAAEGRSLRCRAVAREDTPLHRAAMSHFGSWGNGVKASGFDYEKIRWKKFRTRDAVGNSLCEWVQRHGPLSLSDLRSSDNALYLATRKTFGSPKKAARELGLPFHMKIQRWSPSVVTEAIKRRAAEGRPLDLASTRRDDVRLYSAARTHFGSWKNAINASGFDYSRIRRPKSVPAKKRT